MKYIHLKICSVILLLLASIDYATASEFNNKFDISARYDNRTDRPSREQYRIRWYSELSFDDTWSLHSFAVTGDEFSSSYNTVGESGEFNFRRLYLSHTDGDYKTEIGIIPTYKGRVSSTGLSKDGWISGVRVVNKFDAIGTVEIVVGDINNIEAANSISFTEKINYIELELTTDINEWWDYELGLDRILDGNYIRTELRFKPNRDANIAAEVITRLDNSETKSILSHSNILFKDSYPIELFAFYSYVRPEFGPRAELVEDFLDTGHAVQLEFEGELSNQLDWFFKVGFYEEQNRFQLGVKFKL